MTRNRSLLTGPGPCRALWSFVALWGMLAVISAAAAQAAVDGRRVLVHGEPFVMRAVCYQPTPVGQTATQPPFGDYFTANYRALYERDLPQMRAMGANTLRTYNWEPAADHTHFLDAAWNNGVQPIHVLVNAYIDPATDWSNPSVVTGLKNRWRSLAARIASHPAVIGFLIGNELNVVSRNSPAFWNAINDIAGTVRAVATNQLVTTPLADTDVIASIRAYDARITNLNCWAIQAYRGRSFGQLFSQYEAVSTKPLLISEFGMDAYDSRVRAEYANDAFQTADYVRALWNEIARRTNSVAGGAIFEWSDEWWKDQGPGNSLTRQDTGQWAVAGFPDGTAEHEWWGIFRAATASTPTPTPRAAFRIFQELWNAPKTRFADAAIGADGAFTATVEGPAGVVYRVQGSEDLLVWSNVVTNRLPFRFTDPPVAGRAARHYRAVEHR